MPISRARAVGTGPSRRTNPPMGARWYRSTMETTIDAGGRIVVPKPLREALGLVAGSTVDISRYGAGLQIVPTGRTARLVEQDGVLVATGDTAIDDHDVFALIDAGRR
jgi:AbrB family looped-hinge helix DNA binding protein